MAIDEKTRLNLRQAFAELIGPELADAAMEAMPNIDYTELATKTDVDNVRVELRGEMAELRGELKGEMAELRGEMAELRGDMVGLKAELKGEIAELRGELSEVRGDLKAEMTTNLRISLLTQAGTTVAILGALVGLG